MSRTTIALMTWLAAIALFLQRAASGDDLVGPLALILISHIGLRVEQIERDRMSMRANGSPQAKHTQEDAPK